MLDKMNQTTIDQDVLAKLIQAVEYMHSTIRDSRMGPVLEDRGINLKYLDDAFEAIQP